MIDRECFEESFIDNTSSRFAVFSDLSPQLVVPPAFSPCPDTNGGIDLLLIGSPGCLTLRLPRMNQMWNGGSTKLQVTKGYWTVVRAKLLPIVNETFV